MHIHTAAVIAVIHLVVGILIGVALTTYTYQPRPAVHTEPIYSA